MLASAECVARIRRVLVVQARDHHRVDCVVAHQLLDRCCRSPKTELASGVDAARPTARRYRLQSNPCGLERRCQYTCCILTGTNKADNGLCLFRQDYQVHETEIFIQKIRFKEVGKVGSIKLEYIEDTGDYAEISDRGN